MKKLFLTALIAATAAVSSAQETKFGIKAGVNFANQTYEAEGFSLTPSSVTSFHFAGLVDLGVSPVFSIQPGIAISGKGAKSDISEGSESVESTINLMYIEVPVNAVARFAAGPGKFFLGAGPYAGFGISGKAKSKYSLGGQSGSEEEDIEFGKDKDYKPLDFGLNFLGGYELKSGLNFGLGYGLGLSDIGTEEEATVKNKVFSVSVGFLF